MHFSMALLSRASGTRLGHVAVLESLWNFVKILLQPKNSCKYRTANINKNHLNKINEFSWFKLVEAVSKQICIGLKWYQRLTFEICSAAETFYTKIRRVIQHIPNALNYTNDILLFGKLWKYTVKLFMWYLTVLQQLIWHIIKSNMNWMRQC